MGSDGLHVGANGDVTPLSEGDVIMQVPEASRLAMLLPGLVFLCLLDQLRRRRAAARECP